MSRIRSFAAPHKGLRNALSQFSFALGHTDFADPESLQRLKKLGEEMFLLLNDHVGTENEYTLRRLEERAPGASEHDKEDHERLEKIQEVLEMQLNRFSGVESVDDIHQYYLSFSRFHSEYLAHTYEEETVTDLLLQEHFTDDELIHHRMTIMQKIPFPVLLLWLKYIIPAQNEHDSLPMLRGLKSNMPAKQFHDIMETLKSVLPEDRYGRLRT